MTCKIPARFAAASLLILLSVGLAAAQKTVPKSVPKPAAKPAKSIIFAVLNDGTTIEPIGYVDKGKVEPSVNGSDEASIISAFAKTYYKAGAVYRLIFGGADAGTATVKSSNTKADCAPNTAKVVTKAAKTPLKGLVMGLATNSPSKWSAASFRRKPTDAERNEIEALVKTEFTKQKLTPKVLRYQNLTALDIDADGKAEFVGSYWVEVDAQTRALLFFIATKASSGKYAISHREFRTIDQASVMSGEIKAVDDGIYHELLLDAFDVDGDGTAEIFTYTQSFEGAGFRVYSRSGGKWNQVFDGSNYHCAY